MPIIPLEVVPDPYGAVSMGAAMPAYRAYAVERDGRLSTFVEVEAEDDAAAIWLAQALAEFYPVELWRQESLQESRQESPTMRCLGRFMPDE